MADAFAGIAAGFSQAMGGPYHPGKVHTTTPPVLDDGGSIIAPGTPVRRDCLCQVDAATEAMRADAGFVERDVALLILSLSGPLGTDARVEVKAGPGVGTYSVQSVGRDPAGLGYVCRGRPA